MAEKKFSVYPGKFICHTCQEEVRSLRLWLDTSRVTWMCTQKHVSEVLMIKTKKDYKKENNERKI